MVNGSLEVTDKVNKIKIQRKFSLLKKKNNLRSLSCNYR